MHTISPSEQLWSDVPGATIRTIAGTRVIEAGEGAPLILLHGGGGHAENFRHNVAAYAQYFRVLAVDMRWHGKSSSDGEPDQLIPELVDGVLAVLEAQGIERCFIEGQSMGGWVATRLTLAHPRLVAGLVLTTPMGLLDAVIDDADELAAVLKSQLEALSNPTTDGIRRRMSGLFADASLLENAVVAVREEIYSEPASNDALKKVAQRYFDVEQVRRYRVPETELSQLNLPVLVYWGTANDFSSEFGEAIAAAIPDARYHCAVAGHWAQYENFTEHNKVVLEFLRSLQL